mmetsp:Transcript_17242/g.37726  ORF Transcript_17242/g.37726 Transcript_17242/m.37726 type:complete len:227 (+) Transcript_17242:252-932(+)
MTLSTRLTSGTVNCALSFLPPPLPFIPSVTPKHQALQSKSRPFGAMAITRKRLASLSAEMIMIALSLIFFVKAVATFFPSFASTPKSNRNTTLFPSVASPASIALTLISSVMPAIRFFFQVMTFFNMPAMVSRKAVFLTVEITNASHSRVRLFTNASNSSPPSNFEAASNFVWNPSAAAMAFFASSHVTKTIRRMPLAIPSSFNKQKAPASFVFTRCVPPQNSTLY